MTGLQIGHCKMQIANWRESEPFQFCNLQFAMADLQFVLRRWMPTCGIRLLETEVEVSP